MTIDWGLIRDFEGAGILVGYVPAPSSSRSGVTIATGVDLGARSAAEIAALNIPGPLRSELIPYAGLQGQQALAFLAAHPLRISKSDADALDQAIQEQILTQLAAQYDRAVAGIPGRLRFAQLSNAQQTVLGSVAFQYGPHLSGAAPRFWDAAAAQDWRSVIAELRDFGDNYPRRRNKEADYLEGHP